jgi:hypothetical protein
MSRGVLRNYKRRTSKSVESLGVLAFEFIGRIEENNLGSMCRQVV